MLLDLVARFMVGLNSDAGRRFVANQIEKHRFENGMRIGIGRLDGSLYGEMVIRDFTLSDPQGVFLRSPELRIDWRPFAYLSNHVDVRSATAKTLVLEKIPAKLAAEDARSVSIPIIGIGAGGGVDGQVLVLDRHARHQQRVQSALPEAICRYAHRGLRRRGGLCA